MSNMEAISLKLWNYLSHQKDNYFSGFLIKTLNCSKFAPVFYANYIERYDLNLNFLRY